MKYFAYLCISALILLGYSPAFGREVIETTVDVPMEKTGADAKQNAIDKAIEEGTFQAAQEILGPDKALKIWNQIKPKILRSSTRYVLFIKSSQPQQKGGSSSVSVFLRISSSSLEALFRDEGVIATSQDGSVRLLPLVRFIDATGGGYSWWMDLGEDRSAAVAKDLFKQFQTQLAGQFKGRSVYVFDTTQPSFRLSVPGTLRSESLRREDQSTLAQYLKADVVMSGVIRLVKIRPDSVQLRLEYDIQLWQARTGRILTEIQRQMDLVQVDSNKATLQQTESSNLKMIDEMGTRVSEAITTGALNLAVVRISVSGSLGYAQLEHFKKSLLDQTRELRNLKDRLFEPGRVSFEADSQVPASDLAKVLARYKDPQFEMEVRDVSNQSLNLWVRAR